MESISNFSSMHINSKNGDNSMEMDNSQKNNEYEFQKVAYSINDSESHAPNLVEEVQSPNGRNFGSNQSLNEAHCSSTPCITITPAPAVASSTDDDSKHQEIDVKEVKAFLNRISRTASGSLRFILPNHNVKVIVTPPSSSPTSEPSSFPQSVPVHTFQPSPFSTFDSQALSKSITELPHEFAAPTQRFSTHHIDVESILKKINEKSVPRQLRFKYTPYVVSSNCIPDITISEFDVNVNEKAKEDTNKTTNASTDNEKENESERNRQGIDQARVKNVASNLSYPKGVPRRIRFHV